MPVANNGFSRKNVILETRKENGKVGRCALLLSELLIIETFAKI